MRRVHGAGGQQHLRSGTRLPHFVALPKRNPAYPSSLAVQAQYMRVGLEVKVRPPHGWTEEGGGRAVAVALADGALVVRDAFLRCAVVVGIARNADALRTGDEGFADRVPLVDIRDVQRTACAAIGVRPGRAVLGATEIGQDLVIRPAAIAELRP